MLEACRECVVIMRMAKRNGLTCSVTFTCNTPGCGFERTFKLYETVKENRRGPKRAVINKQFGHAVQDSTLGMHGACQFFASLDLATLSASNCQRLASLVNKEMTDINDKDMQRLKCQRIRDNRACGLDVNRERDVAISVDTRYNSTHFGDRKKLGISATQAVTTAVDSCNGYIIDFVMENRVCSQGSLSNNSREVCATGSKQHECSATVPVTENMNEGNMNKKLGERLLESGLVPVTVTSDNDGQGAKPYQALMRRGANGQREVIAQSDPSHLANSQVRAVENMTIHKEAFACTKVKNATTLKKLLAKDIKYRSSIIVQQARQLNLNDTQVTSLARAAVECFCGDHQQCSKLAGSSCAGMPEKHWMLCSSLYRVAGVVHVNFNEQERRRLFEIFNIRLHSSALNATRYGFDTQRNEAFNRALSKNLPKNVVFKKNFLGRASSTVYRYNNGHSSVAAKLRQFGCPLKVGGVGMTRLNQQQHTIKQQRAYQITERYRKRRAMSRMKSAQEWFRRKTVQSNEHDYCKGQNDPYQFEEMNDHGYCK